MKTIIKGCLAIPVFCMRDSSYITPRSSSKITRAYHEVIGSVKWKQPGDDTLLRDVEVQICCQPERRQPAAKDNTTASDYDHSTDCHPFWHIRRSNCVTEINCEIVGVEIKTITNSSMTHLKTDGNTPTSGVPDFTATVPCIKNTADITLGTEIMLRWEKKVEAKETKVKKRIISAFSQQAPKRKKSKG